MSDATASNSRSIDSRFQTMADQAPVMIWISGLDRGRHAFNKVWLDFRGRTEEQEAGDGWSEGVHPEDYAGCFETYASSSDQREPFEMEYRLQRHDGQYRWILERGSPMHSDAGEFFGYVGSCIDITERKRGEQRLLASEERFRRAADAARLGAWDWDLHDKVTWSRTLEEMYGYDPGGFPGTMSAFAERVHPEDRERVTQLVQETVAGGGVLDFEHRIVLPSGEIKWLQARGQLILNERGEPAGMAGIGMDITDRKRFEEQLLESRARAQAVLETAVNGIITIDESGTVESINPAATEIFGYSEEEVIGKNVRMLMPSPYRQEHDGYLNRYLRTGERRIIGIGREVEGLRKDGHRFPLELAVSEVWINGRRIFTGIINDVSERRQAEQRLYILAQAGSLLHASLDYSSTLQSVAELLVPAVADWLIVDLIEEDEAKRLLVKHRDPTLFEPALELQEKYGPDQDRDMGLLRVLQTGSPEMVTEMPGLLPDRERVTDELRSIIERLGLLSYICVPITSHGQVQGVLTLVASSQSGRRFDEQDLQLFLELGRRIGRAIENARLYRQSELARAQLELSNKAKDEFLGIVSHELRTPVATIFGSSRLINQRWELLGEQAVKELLEGVEQESEKMFQMVENMLLLASAEMGQTPASSVLDLSDIVAKAVQSLARESPARDVNVENLLEPGTLITAVPTYVEQMLWNLLTNADKYSPPEEPIDVAIRRAGDDVVVSVRDRGPGVPAEEMSVLFESFYRSPRVADKLPGKGLGLAVCRRLAEAQGGRVWAQPGPGGGLEVAFALPLRDTSSAKSV